MFAGLLVNPERERRSLCLTWHSGCLSLNLISTAPSGQVVERELAGRMRSGPTLLAVLARRVARRSGEQQRAPQPFPAPARTSPAHTTIRLNSVIQLQNVQNV